MKKPLSRLDAKGEMLVARFRQDLAQLPPPERIEALVDFFGCALSVMNRSEITALRGELVAHYGETHELIEILDGHLSLRDICASE